MIKFENTEVVGWEAAIRGMRNPMNSWEKSDSQTCTKETYGHCRGCSAFTDNCTCTEGDFAIGPNDHDLMMRLRKAGSDHRKYLRFIQVYVDITAPLYMLKELDTYRFGVEKNSCSTMHKIHAKEFTLDDFSTEHLQKFSEMDFTISIKDTINFLNTARKLYLETKDKRYWWQMIQLLPSSYNQKRTFIFSYESLVNIYNARKGHRLDEWSVGFINWIESLPYAELITGGKNDIR